MFLVGTKEGEETPDQPPGKVTIKFNQEGVSDDDTKAEDKTPVDKQKGQKQPPEKKDTPPPPTPKQPS